jgi:hypothetical protein
VLVLTGREARTFPPDIVRRLFWRVYARQVWDPALPALANVTLPVDASLETRVAKGEAVSSLAAIQSVLFPEDDDGE